MEPIKEDSWGEIAQLGGVEAFNIIKEHDLQLIAPSMKYP
jgi:hypothetical protein